jgi:hypothetical protein
MSEDKAPIKLKSDVDRDPISANLERYVSDGHGHDVRRRIYVPTIGEEMSAELACRVVKEFRDLIPATSLDLSSGALKFEYFRKMLKEGARDHWDACATEVAGTSDANFETCLQSWFTRYFEPTAFSDQKEYLMTCTKAFSMTVKETSSRLKLIVSYMRNMPGAPAAGTDIYSDLEFKTMFLRMMTPAWKTQFERQGIDITDDDFTLDRLITFMSAQERAEKRRFGGRESSRGGRGFGRRGSGRYNSDSYGGRRYGFQGRGRGNYSSEYDRNYEQRRLGYTSGRYSGQTRSYDGSGFSPPAHRTRYNTQHGHSYRQRGPGGFLLRGGGRDSSQGGRSSGGRFSGRGRSSGRSGRTSGGRFSGRGRGAYHSDSYQAEESQEGVGASFDSNDFPVDETASEEHHYDDMYAAQGEEYYGEEYEESGDYGYGDY